MTSKIEWTDRTWNPVTGCTKVSPGCRNCYAERMAKRLQGMGRPGYENGFAVTLHPERLEQPLHWKKPSKIFVCSMGDLFHEDVTTEFIYSVFTTMLATPHHTYQVLTKRPSGFFMLKKWMIDLPNVWFGVTAETRTHLQRAGDLIMGIPDGIKFLSLEPLLEPLGILDLVYFDQVIVGGESGPGARPMKIDWVREIRDQCIEQDVPFFFKQWGGVQKAKAGRELDGRTWSQWPGEGR